MKPQRGSSIAGPSLGGLWGRSATGDNGQAAKERSCRYGDGAECRKNISGVPTGEVFFHLTSFIGRKLVTPYRIAIGKINIDDADAVDNCLQEPRMAIGIISDESLSNRLHRISRQNRNTVIGLLRYRDTLIAERL